MIDINDESDHPNIADQGRMNNLITAHFCQTKGSDLDIESVRREARRMSDGDAKIDRTFNLKVMASIRPMFVNVVSSQAI